MLSETKRKKGFIERREKIDEKQRIENWDNTEGEKEKKCHVNLQIIIIIIFFLMKASQKTKDWIKLVIENKKD